MNRWTSERDADIRRRAARGERIVDIARLYGVTPSCACRIVHHESTREAKESDRFFRELWEAAEPLGIDDRVTARLCSVLRKNGVYSVAGLKRAGDSVLGIDGIGPKLHAVIAAAVQNREKAIGK